MRAIVPVLLLLAATAQSQSHDLIQGYITYGDLILYRTTEYKYGFPFVVRSSNVVYPEAGMSNYAYIKAIYVKDNYANGRGGFPKITAGGVGQKFVNIRLKSQRGEGFNFTITIYGHY